MTNNLAEYTAALKALEWAAESGLVGLTLRTDSQLVAYQVTGAWQCRAANLWPFLADLRALVAVTDARVEWVPREQNAKADELSRQAYAQARNGGGS
jgi:ribonuclease HI